MNRIILAICIALLIAGFVCCADKITSSISSNGAVWVSSSVIGPGQTYAASIFTSDVATLMRDLQIGSKVQTSTVARSSGPMGIDEYSSQFTNETANSDNCVFEVQNVTNSQDEISYLGLLTNGTYGSSRTLRSSETSATTLVNGSGMILARASSDDGINQTAHASDAAGDLNMTERIQFGGDE